ncbi:hypothetical protein [Ensifer sp. LC163]|uniref:hypothetical protein n=1 Tax=Ensifer sp. LC163 TaxID=1120652 RepID=UPI00081380FA|nr:hypothetical protein [Ensifer sp. LC163]OCP37930.1 hypothetical protein BC360_19990 [Ensifer sp. LC163]
MSWLAAKLATLKGYALAVAGAAVFLVFAYLRARQDGQNAAIAEQRRKQADAQVRFRNLHTSNNYAGAALACTALVIRSVAP